MSSDLKLVLLRKKEEAFEKECEEIVERLEHLKSLLIKIAKVGKWSLPVMVRGLETHHPEYEKDLGLLEVCGLIKSRVRYTEHNAYNEYTVTNSGAALVRKLLTKNVRAQR